MKKYIIVASLIICSPVLGMKMLYSEGSSNQPPSHHIATEYDTEDIQDLKANLAFLGIKTKSNDHDTSKDGKKSNNLFANTIQKYETAQLAKLQERAKKKSKV